MKKISNSIFIATLLAFVPEAGAGNDPSAWVRTNPFLRGTALQAVQFRLCSEYRATRDLSTCLSDGRKLDEIISFSGKLSDAEYTRLAHAFQAPVDEVKKIAITAIHTDRLAPLLKSSSTVGYLRNVNFYHRYSPEFNLWSVSVAESSSKFEALERIAVLFQDLSESKEHLSWALSQELPKISVDELLKTNAELAQDLKLGVVGATDVKHQAHFPAAVFKRDPSSFSPGAYHFYSTAYWVTRLRKSGVSRDNAILHAFGIHLAYELSSLSQNRNLWPVGFLPLKVDSAYKSRDLATAYWGAVYGAALTDQKPVPAPTAGLAKRLQTNLRGEVRRLLGK